MKYLNDKYDLYENTSLNVPVQYLIIKDILKRQLLQRPTFISIKKNNMLGGNLINANRLTPDEWRIWVWITITVERF